MSTEKKLTAMQDLKSDLQDTILKGNEALNEIEDIHVRECCQKTLELTLKNIIKRIDNELLELEKQQIKNECVEFSKYIRNGKDHFNNGYSTEMVYDEFIKN